MNSEVKVKHGTTKVFVTIGTSLTVALVVLVLFVPGLSQALVVGAYAIVGIVSSVAGLYVVHTAKMLGITRHNAQVLIVPPGHSVYHTGWHELTAEPPLLTDGKPVVTGKWETLTEVIDAETNGIKRLSVHGIDPYNLQNFAAGVLGGKSFAQLPAKDAGIARDQFNAWVGDMVSSGFAYRKHPTNERMGYGLTVSGKAYLRSLASTPLPHQGDGA